MRIDGLGQTHLFSLWPTRLLQNPSGVFCKREVRIQKTGARIIEHVDRERVTILNTEF